jgi:hypothetical protein
LAANLAFHLTRPRLVAPTPVLALTAAFRTTGHAQESAAETITALTDQFVGVWKITKHLAD